MGKPVRDFMEAERTVEPVRARLIPEFLKGKDEQLISSVITT